jgi:hypothetical protein
MANSATAFAVVWRQLDGSGMEHCRLTDDVLAPSLDGAVVVVDANVPWRLDFRITCDGHWQTRAVSVRAVEGVTDHLLNLAADDQGHWIVNGAARSDLDGCLDVDLGFSPSTNTLPIRRLGLGVDQTMTIDVAWVEFPSLTVRRASQRYTRLAERRWRFEYLTTGFTADIDVDEHGLVVSYPPLWSRVDPA